VFPHKLYLHQAIRLVRRLSRLRVSAQILPLADRAGSHRSDLFSP